jgi:hypothetical protein
VGGLAARAERFADLLPCGAFGIPGQGDVSLGQAVGLIGESGGADGKEQVLGGGRARGPSSLALQGSCEFLDGVAD